MNIQDAAYKTVHDYPGGSESLAPRLGMSAAVLRNKVNPNNSTHHLTLKESSDIMGVSGDHRILHALAGEHGYTLTPIDNEDATGSIMSALLMASAAKGGLASTVAAAIADGHITPNEAQAIAKACAAVQAAMVQITLQAQADSTRGAPA